MLPILYYQQSLRIESNITKEFVTIQPPVVTVQIAADMFENKAKTRSVLLHMSIFNAVIGQNSG